MEKTLKIRAHHLLCIQGFQGYGYNREFIQKFAEIVKRIESNPAAQIITECDEICFCCPYIVEGICQKSSDAAQNVKDMDQSLMKKLSIEDGAKGKIKDFISLTNTKLKRSLDVEEVCGNCSWREKCTWFTSLII